MLKKLNRKTSGASRNRPVKVLQFGGGNFLRGFADWVIDVLNEKTEFNGSIDVITSVTPGTAELINEQEGIYHLVQQGYKNGKRFSETRLITCINRAINPAQDFQKFLDSALDPHLRFIISNTTETGITFDKSDSSIETLPNSFPGKLTLLLYHRFNHFNGSRDKTVIVIPCELIEKNGEALREIVLRYASHWNLAPEFSAWVSQNIFCNTLVDRIVPGFPKETIDEIYRSTGYEDKLTVAAEPFYFWAIEAPSSVQHEFPTDRAGLDGVVFATDITHYRVRKVRILNGAHTALMPVAYLRGIRTVKEAMDDPSLSKFVQETIQQEIIPTLHLPQKELSDFANAVEDRFRNPFIKHLLISIALNSVAKFKVRILPTITEYIRINGKLPQNLMVSFAALICFYRGNWNGEAIALNDTPYNISAIQNAWKESATSKTVQKVLSNTSLWDTDLTTIDGLTAAVTARVEELLSTEKLQVR